MSAAKLIPAFRRVALIGGSGPMPACFIQAFKQAGDEFEVTILTRKESLEATGQAVTGYPQFHVAPVDYSDEAELFKILNRQQVVISLLTPAGMQSQETIIRVARAAGVKWFLPSEFGLDLSVPANREIPLFVGKIAARNALEEQAAKSMAYTYVVTGAFADMFVNPFHDWDTENHTVIVPDAGDHGQTKISFTTRQDVAYYTLAVLRRFDQFKNKTARVASFTASYADWVSAFKSVNGVKYTPTYEPLSELERRMVSAAAAATKDPTAVDFKYIADQLHAAMASGRGQLDVDGQKLDSDDMSEVSPTPLAAIVADIH
ncbi:hypothetical protein GGH94_005382 [Coemansia aciculifera]|uniref:NmrA-like domain-containing protein n=1 Tax=Coemansia aciculifera TaxID=417176 RepID=A0A9W8M4D2_9FUNG|nr:hypothetical protein GGH94_005382 [Coemansia aciculifera]